MAKIDPRAYKDWDEAFNQQQDKSEDQNPELYNTPLVHGGFNSFMPVKPQGSFNQNIVKPAIMNEYGTPQNYIDESNKNIQPPSQGQPYPENINPKPTPGLLDLMSKGSRAPASMMPDTYQSMTQGQQPQPDQAGRISDQQAQDSAPKETPFQPTPAMGDAMVGASHALLGLLSGNYNRAGMEADASNNYLTGRSALLQSQQKANNLVKTVDENGDPIYTQAQDAPGQEAYVRPYYGANGNKAPQYLKNKDTGETTIASWIGNQAVRKNADGTQEALDPDKWFKFEPDKYLRTPTAAGGVNFTKIDQVSGQQSAGPSASGVGDYVRDAQGKSVPKEIAKQNIQTAGASAKEGVKYSDARAAMSQAMEVIKDPGSKGADLSSALETVKKQMLGQRLSTYESGRFEGDQYDSLLQNLQNYSSKKISGTPADFKRDEFIQMAQSGINELDAKINNRQGVAGGVKGVNTGAAPTPPQPTSKASSAQLIQAQSVAAARVKNGQWTQQKADAFLQHVRSGN